MNLSKFVRQAHRWVSIAFTVTVVVNIILVASGKSVEWLYMLPLAPLLLLIPTGLYMFFLPYFRKPR
ncbi:hypothetical protein [Pseudoxanthomonas sp. PXM02]|uniref:hypothetical protein n=1 Tax=Pseudoxanthomonas sp. PXM02 TaxID=2769294 RepID=UPI00177FC3CF|nr:hypothetical protein [Pseudoxanthomonas sp. PXM02]MBD9480345.1 hypothetical protein [Pseudoxanthomonas sp. PXM02]